MKDPFTIIDSSVFRALDIAQLECIIVGVSAEGELFLTTELLNAKTNDKLMWHVANDLQKKIGSTLWLRGLFSLAGPSVLVVRCAKGMNDSAFRTVVIAAAKELKAKSDLQEAPFQKILVALPEISVRQTRPHGELLYKRNDDWKVGQTIVNFHDVFYKFSLKTESAVKQNYFPESILLMSDDGVQDNTVQDALAIAEGRRWAKNLANLRCKPEHIASNAVDLTVIHPSLEVEVFSKDDMAYAGMNGILQVGRGSSDEPQFIRIDYMGNPNSKKEKIVIIGKGVCFDSGGLHLKPESLDMHLDKCGAAAALGFIHAVAQAQLPVNVVVLIPAVTNMTGSNAYKPGDIYTSILGQSIEVTNTDAEGRLILIEAIGYAIKHIQDIAVLIDIATLTGAARVALSTWTALFSNDERMSWRMLEASTNTGDYAWPMPLDLEYEHFLSEGTPADIKNHVAGKGGGAIMAALFLNKSVKQGAFPWIHLDIAGSGWTEAREATGVPVAALYQFCKILMREKIV